MTNTLKYTTAILALGATGGMFGAAHAAESGARYMKDASFCEKGYSNLDQNGDNQISEKEVAKDMDLRFGELDANGDGKVSRREYQDCSQQSASQSAAKTDRSAADLKAMDTNNDGNVGPQEYMKATDKAHRKASQASSADAPEVLVFRRLVFVPVNAKDEDVRSMNAEDAAARSRQMFGRLDQDGNGTLSGEEWSNAPSKAPDMSKAVDKKFDKVDQDKSDSISRDEFEQASAQWAKYAEKNAENAGSDRNQSGNSGQSDNSAQNSTAASSQGSSGSSSQSASNDSAQGGDQNPPMVYYYYW